MNKSVKIGDTEFSPDDLKALKTFRDWKILREAAGLKHVGMGFDKKTGNNQHLTHVNGYDTHRITNTRNDSQ